jgi:type I restriction enzyme S subunit
MSDLIPDGWNTTRFDQFAVLQRGFDLPTQDRVIGPYPIYGSNGIVGYHNEAKVKAAGVVTGRSGSIGDVSFVSCDFWALNTSLYIKNFQGNDPKYVFYFLTHFDLSRFSTGTGVPTLNRNDVHIASVIFPPHPEQQKIAAILTSVDEVIEKTQAKIDKLKDLKTGMMQELLTKGIGHTEFKDSPVGTIPVGWDVTPLEKLCSLVGVGIACSTTHAYTNNGVALLRNQNILRDGIRTTEMLYITEDFSEENASKKIYKRDVISIRTGYPGVSAVVPDEFDACHSFTTLISRPKESLLNSDYLALLLNSDYGKSFVTGAQAGGAQQNLNSTVLKTFPVILPSIEEQERIFNTVEAVSIKLRFVIERKNRIQSIKKALMQDLLTGKVRVNTAQITTETAVN